MITWRYTKKIIDVNSISEFETAYGHRFEKEYIDCVMQNNGGRPSASVYDTSNTKERTIKKLLSYNKADSESIWQTNEYLAMSNPELVGFAIDDFGNTICFLKEKTSVVFLSHETGKIEHLSNDFQDFLAMLRQENA